MARRHPLKGKQRSAFAATGSSLADGASNQTIDGDAHAVDEVALSQNQGRPRDTKQHGRQTKSKRPLSSMESTAVAGKQCPACEQRHDLKDCFYAYPDKQPEWFRPNPAMVKLVRFRLEHDPDLQSNVRGGKRQKSSTPTIKRLQTSTPTRITEADNE